MDDSAPLVRILGDRASVVGRFPASHIAADEDPRTSTILHRLDAERKEPVEAVKGRESD